MPCIKGRRVHYIRMLIDISQPDVYAYFHDFRRLCSWKIVNSITFSPCNKGKVVYYIRERIISQSNACAHFHDFRRLSSWKAFWAQMSWSNMSSNSILGVLSP